MDTKNTLIKHSMGLLRDNPHHAFFAVTIRIKERFHRKFPLHTRMNITEEILKNIILKYEAHLVSVPNKPKNQHLKIISHNAIETKTRTGSPDFPHSHGIWGIHDTLLEKWNSQDFHDGILELGSFKQDDQSYPLRKVIQSIHREGFASNLMDKTTPEGWLDYAYKWSDDDDPLKEWSFVQSPINQITKKEIWHEPYPTHQPIFRRLRNFKSRPQTDYHLVV
jgi:hypothetical protein